MDWPRWSKLKLEQQLSLLQLLIREEASIKTASMPIHISQLSQMALTVEIDGTSEKMIVFRMQKIEFGYPIRQQAATT
jgi:hypothetical protein